jgi:hypothetical protein
MYVEASSGNANDKTTLTSPYLFRQTFAQCLTFWYHMYGADIKTLNVYSTSFFLRQLIWTKTGDQGNLWRKAQVGVVLTIYYVNVMYVCDGYTV